MSYVAKIQAKRDLSHLPPKNRAMEQTRNVFNYVNLKLFDAEKALEPKRRIKQSDMTPEIEKFLKEIEMVSQKAKKDLDKVRANINAFIHKYSDLLEIPF